MVAASVPCIEIMASEALERGFEFLSTRERQVFDLLFKYEARWIVSASICVAIYGFDNSDERHGLHVIISRLRRRLRGHPWQIDTLPSRGAYRLMPITPE